MQMNKQ